MKRATDEFRRKTQNYGQPETSIKEEIDNFRVFLEDRERRRVARRIRAYREFRERNYDLVTEEEIEIYSKDQANCGERRVKRRLKLWVKYALRRYEH